MITKFTIVQIKVAIYQPNFLFTCCLISSPYINSQCLTDLHCFNCFSLSGLLNTLDQKKKELRALVSQILMNNEDTSLRRQLLETLIYYNVLTEIPTDSDALPSTKLAENIICTLKSNFGAEQGQIECIDLIKEIEDIVSTTFCMKIDDSGIVVTLRNNPNAG
mgnify:CR=1 FL=1